MLHERSHLGPLRVQRPFHPEGEAGACHVYVLHPPGGVVGGDRLSIEVSAATGARALLTTPAAQKLYRSAAARAEIEQHITVGQDACVEWLPQESIAFEGTRTKVHTRIELASGARFMGWEMLCLGRPASGERFTCGEVVQHIELLQRGALAYWERGVYRGGEETLHAAWGLRGQAVVGTLLAVGPGLLDVVELAREAMACEPSAGLVSVSLVGDVLVARYLGPSTEQARLAFCRVWTALRPPLMGARACVPRIWMT